MAREFLGIVQESAYKVPVATPTYWTQATTYGLTNYHGVYIRLDGGNAFSMRPRPVQVEVPYGGGVAIGAYRVADKLECKGNLSVKLCVGQAPFLLSWASARINTGQTLPWVTTEVPGDLASCAIYHAAQRSDGTFKRRVYLGCKVDSWSFAISEASTIGTLTLGISGSTPQGNVFDSSADPDATAFPAPAENNYAIDPFVYIHASGLITIGGTARSAITELNISSQNTLARRFYATRFLQILRFVGRKTTIASKLLYAVTPDDRAIYESLTSESVSVGLNNGAHGFVMTMHANNVYDPFEDDLPLDDLYFQSNTECNLWDSASTEDYSIAFT